MTIASLEQTLNEFRANVAENMPSEMLAKLQAAIDRLAASQIVSQALSVGQTFPEFSLPNATGNLVSSSELLANGPIIVNFYRGSWCPYCNFELQAFQQLLPEIQAAGAELVAISPQLPDNSLDTIKKINYRFLSLVILTIYWLTNWAFASTLIPNYGPCMNS